MASIFDLPETEQPAGVQEGDVVVVLRRDGTNSLMVYDVDRQTLLDKTLRGEKLTPVEQKDMDNLHRAFCLCVALGTPQLMAILEDVASDPNVIEAAQLSPVVKRMN